jgi:PKD repeat protein
MMKAGPILTLLALVACGCNRAPEEAPPPAIPEGRLPRPAVAVASPAVTVTLEPACVAIITPDVEEGTAPLRVRFTGEGMCTDADGDFKWDFGDGSPPATGTQVEHVYDKPGEYTSRLTLTDPQHNVSDTDEMPISVLQP